jgi:large repetitive protein
MGLDHLGWMAAGYHLMLNNFSKKIFSHCKKRRKIMKVPKSLSIILTLVLVFQLFVPLNNSLASAFVATPKNLIANILNVNDISLSWDAVTGSGRVRYKVYSIKDEQKEYIGLASTPSWSIPKAGQGKYTLAVTALIDGIESELSTPVSFEIIFPDVPSPTDLTARLYNTNDVELKWSAVPNAISYKIYKIVNGNRQLFDSTSTNSKYLYKLTEGEHIFEVSTVSDRFGESINNETIKINVTLPNIIPPSGLTSTLFNGNDIQLNWKPADYASFYNIFQIINGQRIFLTSTPYTNKYFFRMAEGKYEYEVTTVSDRFGESKESTRITQEIIYPQINSPKDLTATIYNQNDVYLQWKPVEYATAYKIYKIINNERKYISATNFTNMFLTYLEEGEHTYEVTAWTDRFGESDFSENIKVNVIYPEINPPKELVATIENGNNVSLKWKPADFATSYYIYEVINGVRKLVSTTKATSFYLQGIEEGEHLYQVTSKSERFGESLLNSEVGVLIINPEMLTPVVQLQIEDSNSVMLNWEKVNYATSYTVYEIINEEVIPLATISGNSYTLKFVSEGVHEYAVTARNNYFGESPLSNIVVADIKPLLEAPTTETPEVTGGNVELDWSPVLGADSYNIYKVENGQLTLVEKTTDTNLTVEDLPEGDHEFRIVPVSPTGVEGENYSTVVVEIEQSDTTPPQTVANEIEEWIQGEYKVELTATDDQSGVAKTFYSINGSPYVEGTSFTVNEDGIHVVAFYSLDNAGNEESPKTTVIKVDKTPPITVSDVKDSWSKDDVTVNLTATDDISGVAKTFYSFNGTDFVEGTSFTVNEEGIKKVYFYSIDNVGNVESTKTAEVKIDKTAPETVSDVTDKWNNGEVTVKLTATDNLSEVDKTFYSLNGQDFNEGTSFTVNEEGVKKVYFYSVDIAGNIEEVKTAEIKIDKTAPETVSDVTDKWNKGEVTINLTATDNLSGVDKTFYSLNGQDFNEGTLFTVNEEGIKTVYFYSVDKAGNVEEVKTAQVKIDKTAPETVSDVIEQWNKGEVTANLTATDNQSGVAKTFYSLNGTDFVEGTSFIVNQEGTNKVYFYSVDNAGNVEATKTAVVKIDNTAPVVSWDLEEEIALGSALSLNYSAYDVLSGISVESVTVNGQVYHKGDNVKLDQPGSYNIIVKVTDHAGNSTTIEKSFVVYIPATLIVNPGVIKANTGDFTVKITLPSGLNTNNIDLSTVTLNGVSAKSGTNGLVQQSKNGQFKFNRDDFKWSKGKILVEFRVLVDGHLVVGSTYVEVK